MLRLPHNRIKALESAHALGRSSNFSLVVVKTNGYIYLMTVDEYKGAVKDKQSFIKDSMPVQMVQSR